MGSMLADNWYMSPITHANPHRITEPLSRAVIRTGWQSVPLSIRQGPFMHTSTCTNPPQAHTQSLTQQLIDTLERFGRESLATLASLYTEDVCFEDPIHGLQGREALMTYLADEFASRDQCQFRFHRRLVGDDEIFLSWTRLLQCARLNSGQPIRLEGATYLKVRDGRIYYQRDYFDAEALVDYNPLVGSFVKRLRRRIAE